MERWGRRRPAAATPLPPFPLQILHPLLVPPFPCLPPLAWPRHSARLGAHLSSRNWKGTQGTSGRPSTLRPLWKISLKPSAMNS